MKIQHRYQLVDLLRYYRLPLIGAEIGVAEGYNSKDLLEQGLELLYSVDNWSEIKGQIGDGGFEQKWHDENYKQTIERLKPFGSKSLILKGLSHEVAKFVKDDSLGLLYLDGDHSYKGVKKDLKTWYSKVIKGGIIAGHDILNPAYGVKEAVEEFICENKIEEINIIPEQSYENASFWFQKI